MCVCICVFACVYECMDVYVCLCLCVPLKNNATFSNYDLCLMKLDDISCGRIYIKLLVHMTNHSNYTQLLGN